MSYTDIHSHILFGVDDGARDIAESERMLDYALRENISTVILTPHFGLSNPGYKRETAEKNFTILKELQEQKYPDMKLFMGNELLWSKGIIDSLKNGESQTLCDTQYILVEFFTDVSFGEMEDAISEFVWNGYFPIIAHAERYDCMKNSPEMVRNIIKCGAYIQVNNRGFTIIKKHFKTKRKNEWAESLLKQNLIHFLASDCHNDTTRNPLYEAVMRDVKGICGESAFNTIVSGNTDSLIRNKKI